MKKRELQPAELSIIQRTQIIAKRERIFAQSLFAVNGQNCRPFRLLHQFPWPPWPLSQSLSSPPSPITDLIPHPLWPTLLPGPIRCDLDPPIHFFYPFTALLTYSRLDPFPFPPLAHYRVFHFLCDLSLLWPPSRDLISSTHPLIHYLISFSFPSFASEISDFWEIIEGLPFFFLFTRKQQMKSMFFLICIFFLS